MRVAHVTATFPPYYGGTGNVCYHNARVLAERGHDVHVYTAAWPGVPDDPPGVTVHRLKPLLRLGNAPLLPQLLRLRGFDLVHLHYPFYTGAEMVALSGLPYVVTYHQDVRIPGLLGRMTSIHDSTVGDRLLRRATRLCPTSLDYFQQSRFACLLERGDGQVVELPNGVDDGRFQPGPIDVAERARRQLPRDGFVVVFVGGMDRAHFFKGVPLLLRALTSLPDVSALMVGDGDLRSDFVELAAELGIADQVRFTGRVPDRHLPAIYRAGDVTILPSWTAGEAFGLVLIEAMACGRPVIASDLPGVRTVVSDGEDGLLVPPGDETALAAAIRSMAALPPERRLAMGMAGRSKVEARYSWERIGDRLEALYLDVLHERMAVHAA